MNQYSGDVGGIHVVPKAFLPRYLRREQTGLKNMPTDDLLCEHEANVVSVIIIPSICLILLCAQEFFFVSLSRVYSPFCQLISF